MPVFFQHQINGNTRIGLWKIEETEEFFKGNVPLHRDVTHPQKRLQHLAGRFLLQYLFPDFPYELIRIADTRKPFIPEEVYHFSIAHCGDFAAAIVSRDRRVGIDIEIPVEKILRIRDKFLRPEEKELIRPGTEVQGTTLLWSAKEASFKWHGAPAVDFRRDILLERIGENEISGRFRDQELKVAYQVFNPVVLTWVIS